MKLATFAATLAFASTAFAQGSLVVPAGTTFVYDTSNGILVLTDLTIEPGGVLRAQGPNRFHVRASATVRIDGLLDVSGFNNPGVASLNTTNISEPGAFGGPGGGQGGTGNPNTTSASPAGLSGFGPPLAPREGGRGGESGISAFGDHQVDARRPGGGGGGSLAADQPVNPDPLNSANIGLIAGPGKNGSLTAQGVVSGVGIPIGGPIGNRAFIDADPTNDFFGIEVTSTGVLKLGELTAPVAGSGGGGGGNAINGQLPFPRCPSTRLRTRREPAAAGAEASASSPRGSSSLESRARSVATAGAAAEVRTRSLSIASAADRVADRAVI